MIRQAMSPLGHFLPRHISAQISEALGDTRVVLVTGPRQSGKSTAVSQIANKEQAEWRTLDNSTTLQSAKVDPTAFVQSDHMMVIDEIQRAPELLLAIKEVVDADPTPGKFLLTGSAHVLSLSSVPDALPGRIETINLWPLSQGEIAGSKKCESLIDSFFEASNPPEYESTLSKDDYIEILIRGGFPEAIARSGRRRESFFDNYVADLINRDVTQITNIERGTQMRALTRLLAARSGNVLVANNLANDLAIAANTVENYVTLLEQVFLIHRVPAWSRNLSNRATKNAKVAFVDSGIAANLLGYDAGGLRRGDGPLGGLLEGFVASELARQITWSETRVELSHFRDRDGIEVDCILEDRRGRVVPIEVKATSTVRAEDFKGINHLATRLGDDLIAGVVLYTGKQTLPFGKKKWAIPISALWQG